MKGACLLVSFSVALVPPKLITPLPCVCLSSIKPQPNPIHRSPHAQSLSSPSSSSSSLSDIAVSFPVYSLGRQSSPHTPQTVIPRSRCTVAEDPVPLAKDYTSLRLRPLAHSTREQFIKSMCIGACLITPHARGEMLGGDQNRFHAALMHWESPSEPSQAFETRASPEMAWYGSHQLLCHLPACSTQACECLGAGTCGYKDR